MDTLIDNRQFPPEMQQISPMLPKEKKSTPWVLILLILIAMGIIAFLVYTIFFRDHITQKQQKELLKERVEKVQHFTQSAPLVSPQERQKRVDTFFK